MGRITLRLDEEPERQLRAEAIRRGISLSDVVRERLQGDTGPLNGNGKPDVAVLAQLIATREQVPLRIARRWVKSGLMKR